MLAEARIDLLLADEKRGGVAACVQGLGQRDARREVAAGAAAGNEEFAHGVTSVSK
jgi:hypothetical protein